MTTNFHGPAADLSRIRAALNDLADGLAQARIDLVTAAETRLESALHARGTTPAVCVDEAARAAIRTELLETRGALARCRLLGGALAEFARCSLAAQGKFGAYDRSGHEAMTARVGAIDARG